MHVATPSYIVCIVTGQELRRVGLLWVQPEWCGNLMKTIGIL